MNVELRGALAALFTCTDREVLVEGRAGTAKTTGAVRKILYNCDQYPGSRHLICRQTRASMTESVLVTLERVMEEYGLPISGPKRDNRHSYDFGNGSSIVCGGLDHPERLFSTEWDTVYVAEATETALDAWEKFGRAMRHRRMPYQQRMADCNPDAPMHWLNLRAYRCSDRLRDVKTRDDYNRLQAYNHGPQGGQSMLMRRLVSVHQDNPGYWDLENWEWTPAGRDFVEGELGRYTGYLRQRLLDGRWRNAQGTVYPEFDQDVHMIAPFAPPEGWPIYCGYDPGFDHPCAWLWFMVAPNNTLYIIDEVVGSMIDLPQLAKMVKQRNLDAGYMPRKCYGDPQYIFANRQESKSVATQMKPLGIHLVGWPTTGGNMDAMVMAVRNRLIDRSLKVFASCQSTVQAFQGWRFKRTAGGEVPAGDADKYEQEYKDAMDVVRGVVATSPKFAATKIEVVR